MELPRLKRILTDPDEFISNGQLKSLSCLRSSSLAPLIDQGKVLINDYQYFTKPLVEKSAC